MRKWLEHANAGLYLCRSGKRFGLSLNGQGADLKTLGSSRLLSLALALMLHLGFLWLVQGSGLPVARSQLPSTRLAPTVLVHLPPLQIQIKTSRLPDTKRPLEPARARNSVPQSNAPPSAADPDPAVLKLATPANPVTQITPATPAPQAPSLPGQAALSAAPSAPEAPEAPKPLNLTLAREAMRALPPASAPVLPSGRLPLTLEQRMSKTLAANGSGPWVEERMDMNHVRFRKGDLCITYTRPQSAGLFPSDASAQQTPWTTPGMQACPN